ncbi:alanine racemase [Microbacteriaceae bacterium SG_E_30_P1]|uniref:Alanine racemase n=1 Tax=Antiquaquibacter oligotrophicus TaxID=2880260 RepID=A0ABT6KJ00_9MICO|nr:alanine racemase [Antiquaquibacter oligotrophicus]MDH6179947.1 alanine racemase [Antiquaquibacter oligotrophicus]UDF14294.1 alanine racemase [Antiquaquibacter oligotrophicus]
MSRLATIDLGAISRNVETLRRAAGGVAAMAVVKADGYGHGAVPSARAVLEGGAERLGVATIDEALELREAGIRAPILAWLHETDAAFPTAVAAGIELGVGSLQQLEAVATTAPGAVLHLKADTGLGRGGATATEWPALVEAAAAHERAGLLRVVGVWSHLSNTGEVEDREQLARFDEALDAARSAGLQPEFVHLAATAATLRLPDARFSLVRLGIGCYGLSPFDDVSSLDLGLTPAMTLETTVVSLKRVPAGHGVSYGYRYRTTEETTLALVPLGYADGVPRAASGRAPVAVGGDAFRVAGSIAMDQFIVDVGDAPIAVGDRVVLFGDPSTGVPSADDWAAAAGTINYEIVTRIGSRVTREYV